jgi:hypothetical protein
MMQVDSYGAPRLTAVEMEGYSRAKVEKTDWLEDKEEEGEGDRTSGANQKKLSHELVCAICHEILNAAVIFPCCVVAGRQLSRSQKKRDSWGKKACLFSAPVQL